MRIAARLGKPTRLACSRYSGRWRSFCTKSNAAKEAARNRCPISSAASVNNLAPYSADSWPLPYSRWDPTAPANPRLPARGRAALSVRGLITRKSPTQLNLRVIPTRPHSLPTACNDFVNGRAIGIRAAPNEVVTLKRWRYSAGVFHLNFQRSGFWSSLNSSLLAGILGFAGVASLGQSVETLPQTQPLTWDGDLSA